MAECVAVMWLGQKISSLFDSESRFLGKNPFKEVFTSHTVILLNNRSHNDIFMPVYSNICCSSPNHSLSLTPHLLAVPSSLVLLRVFLFCFLVLLVVQ